MLPAHHFASWQGRGGKVLHRQMKCSDFPFQLFAFHTYNTALLCPRHPCVCITV